MRSLLLVARTLSATAPHGEGNWEPEQGQALESPRGKIRELEINFDALHFLKQIFHYFSKMENYENVP